MMKRLFNHQNEEKTRNKNNMLREIGLSQDKTKKQKQNECAPSEDSGQPWHLTSLIRAYAVRSMGSQGPKHSSCGQRRL